jgi:hypothetical protein
MNSDANYNKKIDNELKKKELEKEFGALFSESSDLSPEIESEWLKNIEDFEQQFNKHETIKVWDFIGQPDFKKVDELSPVQITAELERVYEILNNNGVALDTLAKVDDTELYRFITEELFEHEIENVRIDGMNLIFIYEEFHPNAELDIKQAFEYFFSMTLGKKKNIAGDGYDLLYLDTKNYKDSEGNVIDERHVQNRINNFLDSFDYFEIVTNEIMDISINDNEKDAVLTFKTHFTGCYNDNTNDFDFKGEGLLKLKLSEYGGWDIYHMSMPGLSI